MEERWRGSLLPRELFTSMWYYLKCLIKASDSFVSLKRKSLSARGVPRSQGEAVPSAIAVSNVCWATCSHQERPLGVLGLWCTKLSFFALKRGQRKLSPTSVPRGCCGLSHAAPTEHTASWDGVRWGDPLMQHPEPKLRSTSRSERILLKNTSPSSVDNNKDKLGQTSIMCVGSNVSSYSYTHLKLKNFPLYLTHKNHFTIFTTEWPHLLFSFLFKIYFSTVNLWREGCHVYLGYDFSVPCSYTFF